TGSRLTLRSACGGARQIFDNSAKRGSSMALIMRSPVLRSSRLPAGRTHDTLVELRENKWPGLAMTIAGGLAGEARVLEDQARGVTDRLQLDRDDGFSPVGTARSCNPREF